MAEYKLDFLESLYCAGTDTHRSSSVTFLREKTYYEQKNSDQLERNESKALKKALR